MKIIRIFSDCFKHLLSAVFTRYRKTWKEEFVELFDVKKMEDLDLNEVMELKLRNLPQSIFKYRIFDSNAFNIGNLKTNSVWLSSPENFNDPFDSGLNVATDSLREDRVRKILPEIKAQAFSHLTFSDAETKAIEKSDHTFIEFMKIVSKKDPAYSHFADPKNLEEAKLSFEMMANERIEKSIAKMRDKLRICSFSEVNDSIIMWSHYSNNHEGFCIEYDISSLGIQNEYFQSLYPVIYSDAVFDSSKLFLNGEENKNHFTPIMAALHKSTEWQYEKEWRLITLSDIEPENLFSFLSPKAVYLGAKIKEENLTNIKAICDEKMIPIFKMSLAKGLFKLEQKKI